MSKWVEWAWAILQVYDNFGESQKAAYKFVLDYKELITELHHVMETVDVVFTKVNIESTFGIYKSIQPKNKHCRITPIVLALPLYGKVTDTKKRRKMDFKEKMECVRMADIKDWKDMTLLDNWQVRRMVNLKSKKRKTA